MRAAEPTQAHRRVHMLDAEQQQQTDSSWQRLGRRDRPPRSTAWNPESDNKLPGSQWYQCEANLLLNFAGGRFTIPSGRRNDQGWESERKKRM